MVLKGTVASPTLVRNYVQKTQLLFDKLEQ